MVPTVYTGSKVCLVHRWNLACNPVGTMVSRAVGKGHVPLHTPTPTYSPSSVHEAINILPILTL